LDPRIPEKKPRLVGQFGPTPWFIAAGTGFRKAFHDVAPSGCGNFAFTDY
jgi:hypothetical protein